MKQLLELGFPNDEIEAFNHDDTEFEGSGVVSAVAFAWLATDGKRNLDPRHLIDDNRQLVEYYIRDTSQLAGTTINEPLFENLRVNPRWTAIVPEPTAFSLLCLATLGLLAFRLRR